ncbi:MAG: beta-lactamase family protein [Sandaracinaceae bacterium]|nr:beta-lactamase family protein [Sandaracinaceae bacterium]
MSSLSYRVSALALALALSGCDAAAPMEDAGADGGVDAGRDAAVVERDAGTPPADFDGFVEWQMDYGGIPGLALAILTPDEIVRVSTYGYADIESGRLVDEHTLFVMASISKTIATVRAMQLVEAGQLDLDAPAGDALGYPLPHPGYPATPVTARELLCHVSGLEDDFPTLAMVTYTEDPPITLDEFTRGYAVEGGAYYSPGHWNEPPGAQKSYANAGFGVIGAILEGAGGASFREQTRVGLFEPLALDGAGWFLADIDLGRVATPYGYNARSRAFTALPQNGFAFYPASSLRISISGLSRFAQMVLRGGELDGTRVLEESSVQEMLRTQYPSASRGQALGFYHQRYAGHDFIGHSGTTYGGSNQMLLAVEGTHALIVITNSDAHVRSLVPALAQGEEAIDAILVRMDEEIR